MESMEPHSRPSFEDFNIAVDRTLTEAGLPAKPECTSFMDYGDKLGPDQMAIVKRFKDWLCNYATANFKQPAADLFNYIKSVETPDVTTLKQHLKEIFKVWKQLQSSAYNQRHFNGPLGADVTSVWGILFDLQHEFDKRGKGDRGLFGEYYVLPNELVEPCMYYLNMIENEGVDEGKLDKYLTDLIASGRIAVIKTGNPLKVSGK